MTHYYLFAGETSGDLHGSHLMQALHHQEDRISFSGVGGPRMRQIGLNCFLPMEKFQVMGFSEVFKALPRLWQLFYSVRDNILKVSPDCLILIDYPGFNLRLARALRRKGFKGKLVQYISPTVWAHGKKRIAVLAAYYDLLLTIYPFEAVYFAQTPLRVEYIGNPLSEAIQKHDYQPDWAKQLGLPSTENLIALFPGSRQGEIARHVPKQLQIASHLKQRHPELQFALSCAQEAFQESLHGLISQSSLRLNEDFFIVPPQYSYELMRTCRTAVAKSGTVSLELALHSTPTVVHYELSTLNYLIAKYFLRLKLPHYCIVNILAGQTIFPEFIDPKGSPEELSRQTANLHFDSHLRRQTIESCENLQEKLGNRLLPQSAARAIQELMQC